MAAVGVPVRHHQLPQLPRASRLGISNFYLLAALLLSAAMKYIFVAIFVFFFVGLPMYVLNNMVMPQLAQLQQTYAHAGQMADRIAAGGR